MSSSVEEPSIEDGIFLRIFHKTWKYVAVSAATAFVCFYPEEVKELFLSILVLIGMMVLLALLFPDKRPQGLISKGFAIMGNTLALALAVFIVVDFTIGW